MDKLKKETASAQSLPNHEQPQNSDLKNKKKLAFRDNVSYSFMCLPVVIKTLIFSILPLLWLVMAFEDYRGFLGIFKSDWVGFDNFKYFFRNGIVWKVIWNTIYLNVLFILVGTPLTIVMALFMFELTNRKLTKIFQTIYFIPYLLSWTVVQYAFEGLLWTEGLINDLIVAFGGSKIQFYQAGSAKWWPFILLLANIWKGQGYSVLMYYASLNSIDTTLFEAAELDGANRFQKMWYVSVPHLRKMMAILLIMSMGGIFRSDFGLFWFIPKNDTDRTLLSTTEVLDTYIYQLSIKEANYSSGTAIGLIQSVVGTLMLLLTNRIVKFIDKDSAFI